MKKKNYNSITSDDIDLKLGLLTKIDKSNKTTPKMLKMTSCQQTMTPLSFFQFMTNLEQSGSRIPDT